MLNIYFIVKKLKINLLVSPKIEKLAKSDGRFVHFTKFYPEIVSPSFFGSNWNMVCSVYFAHPRCIKHLRFRKRKIIIK